MLNRNKLVFLIIPIFLLAACGGGGSSSSGGGGNNQYAGTYTGKVTACASAGGQKFCETSQSFITISGDGTVSSGEEFTGRMDGNKYTLNGVFDMPINGTVCHANIKGNGTVTGNNTKGNASGPVNCDDGTKMTLTMNWDMNKGAAKALNLPSTREAIQEVLSQARD